MAFLTLLTRVHPARPRCLDRCVASVRAQTDQDVQHLLLRPEVEPHDVIKVGPLIHQAASLIQGRYVMQLPDDDRLRSPEFVRELRRIVGPDEAVDLVVHRMAYGVSRICPPDGKWRARAVDVGYIAGQNMVARRDVYAGASHEWLRMVYEADFYYVRTAMSLARNVVWWDFIGIESQGTLGNNAGKAEALIELKPGMGDKKCT
jgi:hypothetical protein